MIGLRNFLGQIGVAVAGAAIAAPALAVELLVPAYMYPGAGDEEWQSLIEVAARQPLSVVFNPSSGVGPDIDSNFVTAIDDLRAAGGKAYGYVPTGKASRSSAEVQAEIDTYLKWYGLDGFFIDEVPTDGDDVGYYKGIQSFVAGKTPTLKLIGNPGTPPDEVYLDAFDTLVLYEDSAADLARVTPPPYQSQHDASRFAMLVYDASEATAKTLIDDAAEANVGFIYVTDTRRFRNLWLELPSYWDSQAAAVANTQGPVISPPDNMAPIPEPSVAVMMIGGLVTIASLARRRHRPACKGRSAAAA